MPTAPQAEGGPTRHVPVVDGLRGLAILLVLAFHYWQLSFWAIRVPGLPYGDDLEFVQFAGFLGVEVFFFVSGFCLFHPHARAMLGAAPVPALRHFAHRRAIKILPSYLLALVLLGLFAEDLYPVGSGRGGVWLDVALHLAFLHDLLPATQGSFAGVLWSLAVEVQFYCLFPLFARAFRRRPGWTAAAMVGLAVAYRAWVVHQPLDDVAWLDSLLPAFLDLFALGMTAAWLTVWISCRTTTARLRGPATVAAAAALGALLVLMRWAYDIRYDGPIAVWQADDRQYLALLLLCLLVASAFAAPWWQRLVANPALVFLSTISYNLYIWHQVVGRMIRDRGWWRAATPNPTDDPVWQWSFSLVGVAASIAVAGALTYAFERPLLRRGVRGVLRATAQGLRERVGFRKPAPATPAG